MTKASTPTCACRSWPSSAPGDGGSRSPRCTTLATETEVKLGAPVGFELPSLDGVAEDVSAVPRIPRTIMAVYYDTPDLRLARWGVTVRHRTGDGTGWTVKLPEGKEGPGLLDAVVGRLREAGASEPGTTAKVIRALGPRALEPPEVAPVSLGKKPSAADVVGQAIAAAVERILRHDPGVRIGDDPEDVYQLRVGTRRLRSDLRTFAPVLDDGWLTPLREQLRWLAGALGAVRDADVLIERLRRQAATLPEPDTDALASIFRRLAGERDQARSELLEAMHSARYVALLERLVDAAHQPAYRKGAKAPAAEVVPRLVARPSRKLRAAVKATPNNPPDADLHRVRILAKRTRYAAEAAAPLVGKKAARFATGVARLQEVLGDHQDAVVAEAWLREAIEGAAAAVCLAAGELIAVQAAEADEGRRQWRKAWKKASGRKRRAWM